MFRDKSVLVTGGTGSFGKRFIKHILDTDNPRKVVVFSRNEANQCEMADEFSGYKDQMRFILGSVTNYERLYRAIRGIDYVVHSAALKVVSKAEYNPLEVADVNVDGTRNVIEACLENGVKRAIYLATDKAVMPVNLYGMTKAVAERCWIEGNYLSPIFSVVRYGNIMGSRGAVVNKFLAQREMGSKDYEITHPEATRFWVNFGEAIRLVLQAFDDKPGLVLASKTKSFKVRDLIKAIYLRAELKVTGLREGEKVHETIVNEFEASRANAMDDHYRIFPAHSYDDTILYDKEHGVPMQKAVTSGDFLNLMTFDEVRKKVEDFVARKAKENGGA